MPLRAVSMLDVLFVVHIFAIGKMDHHHAAHLPIPTPFSVCSTAVTPSTEQPDHASSLCFHSTAFGLPQRPRAGGQTAGCSSSVRRQFLAAVHTVPSVPFVMEVNHESSAVAMAPTAACSHGCVSAETPSLCVRPGLLFRLPRGSLVSSRSVGPRIRIDRGLQRRVRYWRYRLSKQRSVPRRAPPRLLIFLDNGAG